MEILPDAIFSFVCCLTRIFLDGDEGCSVLIISQKLIMLIFHEYPIWKWSRMPFSLLSVVFEENFMTKVTAI